MNKAILAGIAALIAVAALFALTRDSAEAPETPAPDTMAQPTPTKESLPAVDESMLPVPNPGEPVEEPLSVSEFTLDSFNFGYSQTELRVNEGDTVTINLTSSDGFHDWVVDEFKAATEKIQEGETTSVTFVADTAGTYEFYCSVGSHREQGMVGTLIVE